ncbi:MAG: hypothetical protein IKI75_05965 [Lachnospiraceae bacterium]|nr:hypothetical protein [Lachnospiraceae bacterium]
MGNKNEFTMLSAPVIVDIGEWMINNIGMVAVAKRLPDKKKAALYAFERADSATPQMVKYAKDNDAMILVGISEGDVNAID